MTPPPVSLIPVRLAAVRLLRRPVAIPADVRAVNVAALDRAIGRLLGLGPMASPALGGEDPHHFRRLVIGDLRAQRALWLGADTTFAAGDVEPVDAVANEYDCRPLLGGRYPRAPAPPFSAMGSPAAMTADAGGV